MWRLLPSKVLLRLKRLPGGPCAVSRAHLDVALEQVHIRLGSALVGALQMGSTSASISVSVRIRAPCGTRGRRSYCPAAVLR